MNELIPDEINALCEIPEEDYQQLAMAVMDELHPGTCVEMDREVLRRWFAMQEGSDGN